MSKNNIVTAVLLPTGINVEPEEIFIEDFESIQRFVGGHFDCVRTDLGKTDWSLVGYVHDEGLILDFEPNFLATALFGQEIRGACVIVWGLSPNGFYDGDNYDMPTFALKFLKEQLLLKTAAVYNLSVMTEGVMKVLIEEGYPKAKDLVWAMEIIDTTDKTNYNLASMILQEAMRWGVNHLEDEDFSEFCQYALDNGLFNTKDEDN